MMLGAFINGLNIALHLEDLQAQSVVRHWHELFQARLAADSPHLSSLELRRFRGGSFHRGGHYGWLDRLLLGLLRTRDSERSQRVDPIPGAGGRRVSFRFLLGLQWTIRKELFFFLPPLPDVFQELVELESRKLGEPAAGGRQVGWAELYMSISNEKVAPKNQNTSTGATQHINLVWLMS